MKRQRILIATKAPRQVDELRKTLSARGFEVKVVSDGTTALKVSRDFRPQLLLAEIDLPKLDGHHLLKEVRAQTATKDVAFVLMSQHRAVEERVHSINLGVDDYLTAPFEAEEAALRLDLILREIATMESAPARTNKGFRGKLAEINMIELLQILEIGKKSGIVLVHNESDEGVIVVNEGEISDVALDKLTPEEALMRMFTWSLGTFKVELQEIDQDRIFEIPCADIIKNGFRFRDRWDRILEKLPPLQARVKGTPKFSKDEYTEVERAMLGSLNGETRLIDLVRNCELNDLQALQVVAKLFYQGSLQETSPVRKERDQSPPDSRGRQPYSQNTKGEHLFGLVSQFLGHIGNDEKNGRPGSARSSGQASLESKAAAKNSNRVNLNKSELLMVKSKLSRGDKR